MPPRKPLRLQTFDYSQPGYYFVTICAYKMRHLFGEIIDERMELNFLGKIAEHEWVQTSIVRPNVEIDKFIIMPNHIHGIIHLLPRTGDPLGRPHVYGPMRNSIGAIIGQFKAKTTKQIKKIQNTETTIWHRNYFEHIIRNECDLLNTRKYIENNPRKWALDSMYGRPAGSPLPNDHFP